MVNLGQGGERQPPQGPLYTTPQSSLWRPNEGVKGNRRTLCAPAVEARTSKQNSNLAECRVDP
jgi:hypothetical protein